LGGRTACHLHFQISRIFFCASIKQKHDLLHPTIHKFTKSQTEISAHVSLASEIPYCIIHKYIHIFGKKPKFHRSPYHPIANNCYITLFYHGVFCNKCYRLFTVISILVITRDVKLHFSDHHKIYDRCTVSIHTTLFV